MRFGHRYPGAVTGEYDIRSQTLAVKIVRQPQQIALIGAPSSAAAFSAGSEKAPAALRAAGLAAKLRAAGYEVVDYGECATPPFPVDDRHLPTLSLTRSLRALV